MSKIDYTTYIDCMRMFYKKIERLRQLWKIDVLDIVARKMTYDLMSYKAEKNLNVKTLTHRNLTLRS